jgi:hypothetical protein
MSGTVPLLPNTPSWRGAELKHRDNFTFLCLYMGYGKIQGSKLNSNKQSLNLICFNFVRNINFVCYCCI